MSNDALPQGNEILVFSLLSGEWRGLQLLLSPDEGKLSRSGGKAANPRNNFPSCAATMLREQ